MIGDIWQYKEPANEQYGERKEFWSYRGALSKPRNGHSAITIGEETHVFGGLGK